MKAARSGGSPALSLGATIALRLAAAALFLGAWEIAARLGWIKVFFFSRPLAILAQLAEWFGSGYVWRHVLATSAETLVGFALGASLGVGLGLAFALMPRMSAVFEPLMALLNGLPRLVLAPLIILWFGIGFESKVAMAVIIVVFVVFFNTYDGIRDVDRTLVANAKILGASRLDMILHVYLPSTLIWIFSSLRASLGFALVGAVVGEYIVSNAGLGFVIRSAQANFDMTGVCAGLSVLLCLVGLMDIPIRALQRRCSRWKKPSS